MTGGVRALFVLTPFDLFVEKEMCPRAIKDKNKNKNTFYFS